MNKEEKEKWWKDLSKRYNDADKEWKHALGAYEDAWNRFVKVQREMREFTKQDFESRIGKL